MPANIFTKNSLLYENGVSGIFILDYSSKRFDLSEYLFLLLISDSYLTFNHDFGFPLPSLAPLLWIVELDVHKS